MRRRLRRLAAGMALAALASSAGIARAEQLVLSLSSQQVAISSNFTGAQLVVFGIVTRDGQSVARPGTYDVVVTVKGPREAITIRRKEPLGPIWLNRGQQKFIAVPAFLGVYASRPIAGLMPEILRHKLRIGIDAVVGASDFTLEREGRDDPFRAALVRLKARDRLYYENARGVTFVTEDFFRVPISLPATAPLGNYDIEAALMADGVVLARRNSGFAVVKAGFEEDITEFARDHATLYGLATAALALAFGWIASIIFRRD